MAAKALAMMPIALLALGVSCQTQQAALSSAAAVKASTATLSQSLPKSLPESCTARMGRAVQDGSEPWVSVHDRWQTLADNRDDQADSCRKWWERYHADVGSAR